MGVYDDQIASAKETIEEKGQAVTWRSLVDGTPADPNKPWLPSAATETDHPVTIAFFPEIRDNRKSSQDSKDSEVSTGFTRALMAQVDFVPKIKDVVIRGSIEYVVESIDKLDPNGESVILYKLELGT